MRPAPRCPLCNGSLAFGVTCERTVVCPDCWDRLRGKPVGTTLAQRQHQDDARRRRERQEQR